MGNQDHKHKHENERSDHHDGAEDAEKKVKICDDDGAINVVVDENPPPPPPLRECNICGKTFTNGKALGGHRRSHFQALKKNIKKVKPHYNPTKDHNNRASTSNNCYGDDNNRTCYVCDKEFSTKNALFGHMRSHPRDWKGVCPPNNKHTCSSSEEEEEEEEKEDQDNCRVNEQLFTPAIDLSKFTSPSWRKTDKRGRKCIGNYEAARNLMYFSADCCVAQSPKILPPCNKREAGQSSSAEGSVVKKIKFFLSGSFNLGNKGDGDESGSSNRLNYNNRGKCLSEPVVERSDKIMKTELSPVKLQDHDYDDGDYFDESKVSSLSEDHRQKSKSIHYLKESSTTSENEAHQKYKCGTCGKTFTTFQGLGGHRSIHKQKSKITEEDNSGSCKMDDDETPPVSEATLAADEEAGQSRGPKKFDIDLNEPYFDD